MGIESLLPMGLSVLGSLAKSGAGGGGQQQQPPAAPPPIPPLPPTQRMPMPGSLTGGSPSILDMLGQMGGGMDGGSAVGGMRPDDLISLLSGGMNGR